MRRRVSHRKQNNQGSAMVTVIVVVVFVSILATTLLYISGLNYRMKLVDYSTKASFYEAEVPMEEIHAQLVIDASDAFAAAYREAVSGFVEGRNVAERERKFKEAFCKELLRIWDVRDGAGDGNIDAVAAIGNIISNSGGFTVTVGTGFDPGIGSSPPDPFNAVYLRGVEIQYTDSSYYTSIIETDFCINIPHLSWGVDCSSDVWEADARASGEEIDFQQLITYEGWTKK